VGDVGFRNAAIALVDLGRFTAADQHRQLAVHHQRGRPTARTCSAITRCTTSRSFAAAAYSLEISSGRAPRVRTLTFAGVYGPRRNRSRIIIRVHRPPRVAALGSR
jgi:hypothetical protein